MGTSNHFGAAICTYPEFLLFICDSLPPYYFAFTLSMFEGTNVHNLHNIVLCIDVWIYKRGSMHLALIQYTVFHTK